MYWSWSWKRNTYCFRLRGLGQTDTSYDFTKSVDGHNKRRFGFRANPVRKEWSQVPTMGHKRRDGIGFPLRILDSPSARLFQDLGGGAEIAAARGSQYFRELSYIRIERSSQILGCKLLAFNHAS